MKIATWNVNSLKVRLPQVLEWLDAHSPDVLVLQEIKQVTEMFPADEIAEAGYKGIASGQKTYNGVAVIAKDEPQDPITDFPGFDDPQRRILATTINDVRVINLYVPNGSEVGSDKYAYKLGWLAALRGYLEDELSRFGPIDGPSWDGHVGVGLDHKTGRARSCWLPINDAQSIDRWYH